VDEASASAAAAMRRVSFRVNAGRLFIAKTWPETASEVEKPHDNCEKQPQTDGRSQRCRASPDVRGLA
jgi:hypothetical protein